MSIAVAKPSCLPGVLAYSLHHSPRGDVRAHWTAEGLYRLEWGTLAACSNQPGISPENSRLDARTVQLEDALASYFAGSVDSLRSIPVDSSGWSPFFGRVYRLCREIPAGEIKTYGQLAELAGSPKAARAVGQAMAQNRVPLIIPCHRVLATGGGLGGYSGPGGLGTKRWLLELEGYCSRKPR